MDTPVRILLCTFSLGLVSLFGPGPLREILMLDHDISRKRVCLFLYDIVSMDKVVFFPCWGGKPETRRVDMYINPHDFGIGCSHMGMVSVCPHTFGHLV